MAEACTPERAATDWIVVASNPRSTSSSAAAASARWLMLSSRGRPRRRRGSAISKIVVAGARGRLAGGCRRKAFFRRLSPITCSHGDRPARAWPVARTPPPGHARKGKPMRAAVLRGGRVTARTIDDPVPGPGQLLVRSLACGICASDLHFMDHPEAGADDDSGMSTYDTDADIVMGHEYCAEVVGYGPGTERLIPVGTRVSSLPVLATAGGRKIIGQNPESPGGFGEYFLLTEAITRVVTSDLPSEIVCIADAISVGWSAASRAQLTTKEAPLVIGCGAIGLSAIATLRCLGAGPIVAADFVASRRQTALAMGADVAIDPAAVPLHEAWREAAG